MNSENDKTLKSFKKPQGKKEVDLSDLQNFLSQIKTELKPSLHVNGSSYLNCVLTVDFGQPLNPPNISSEEEDKLKEKMRASTKLIVNRPDASIRISNDPLANMYWSTVA